MADNASRQVLWTSRETTDAAIGSSSAPWQASGISIDSRNVQPGDMFIALEGPHFNGHDFVADAFAKGASVVMVAKGHESAAGPCLVVADTLSGLQDLGRAGRNRTTAKIVAVTGSVGKTGSKEALRLALSASGETHASVGSFNNHWGVPLSLARMPRNCAYGVFEIGMNHPGEITPLSEMVRPDLALITNIEPAHMAAFSSLGEVADAKAEVFAGLPHDGIVVLNRDSDQYGRLRHHAEAAGLVNIVAFGVHEEADARLIRHVGGDDFVCVAADIDGDSATFKVGAPGYHWAINGIAVLLIVKRLGANLGLAALALRDLTPPEGRGRRSEISLPEGEFLLIDESYNASPAAMRAAFVNLAAAKPSGLGRRIAVLGDMLELGDMSADLHAELAPELLAAKVDLVFACGMEMRALMTGLPQTKQTAWCENSKILLPKVRAMVRAGDVVMVKGSLGMTMRPIVEALKALDSDAPRQANG